jgi:hypothetical protein
VWSTVLKLLENKIGKKKIYEELEIGDSRVCENWGFRVNRIELEREKLKVKWVCLS